MTLTGEKGVESVPTDTERLDWLIGDGNLLGNAPKVICGVQGLGRVGCLDRYRVAIDAAMRKENK